MNKRILELMKQADYPAPEIALRAQKLCDMLIKDCIQTLVNNGYTDAAKCLHEVNFGMENPV
jgi:hypothetical protein